MKQFLTTFSASALAFVLVLLGYELIQESRKGRVDLDSAYTTEQHEGYMVASVVADGLGTASQVKYLISEFWAMEGRLPCTNEEIAINASFQNPVLRSVALTNCGELTLTYTDKVGIDGARMMLRAVEASGLTGAELQWDCWTPDISGIEIFMPQCRYDRRSTSSNEISIPEETSPTPAS